MVVKQYGSRHSPRERVRHNGVLTAKRSSSPAQFFLARQTMKQTKKSQRNGKHRNTRPAFTTSFPYATGTSGLRILRHISLFRVWNQARKPKTYLPGRS